MKLKTHFLLLGLSALVCLADARAITIAEHTGGTSQSGMAFWGQSFTTDPGSPTSNIAFNFFDFPGATTPVAAGDGFLLSMEYLGTPAGLSSSTPGFLGQATASGGFYTFDPTLTLSPSTQYFFYENVLIGGLSAGGIYTGGHLYFADSASSNFLTGTSSLNFRVTGTPVNSVPDTGASALLLGLSFIGIFVVQRTIGWRQQRVA